VVWFCVLCVFLSYFSVFLFCSRSPTTTPGEYRFFFFFVLLIFLGFAVFCFYYFLFVVQVSGPFLVGIGAVFFFFCLFFFVVLFFLGGFFFFFFVLLFVFFWVHGYLMLVGCDYLTHVIGFGLHTSSPHHLPHVVVFSVVNCLFCNDDCWVVIWFFNFFCWSVPSSIRTLTTDPPHRFFVGILLVSVVMAGWFDFVPPPTRPQTPNLRFVWWFLWFLLFCVAPPLFFVFLLFLGLFDLYFGWSGPPPNPPDPRHPQPPNYPATPPPIFFMYLFIDRGYISDYLLFFSPTQTSVHSTEPGPTAPHHGLILFWFWHCG